MYFLRTFGGLRVEKDGGPLTDVADRRKALALLAAVAAQPGISRERLVTLLWPESSPERARGSLKQEIHSLRRDLDSPDLIRGTTELSLNPDEIQSDVDQFNAAIEANDPARAVDLYTGPFLDGFYLDRVPDLERWIDTKRAELERRCADALEKLASEAEAKGDFDSFVDNRRRLLELDPLSGRYAVGLIAALDRSGNRAEALKQARLHETRVREELGVAPDPAVAALVERIQADARPGTTRSHSSTTSTHDVRAKVAGTGAVSSGSTGQNSEAEIARPIRKGRRSAAIAFLVIACVVLGGMLASKVYTNRRELRAPDASSRSIAVLPFVNLSPDPDQEYFSDGMTDEIITQLSRVNGLRVAARTSSFQFKALNPDVRDVGQRLGVATILDGSVQRAGDRVRITARLVNAKDGYNIWSETYDREASDIFRVQDEITSAIVSALGIRLAAMPQNQPARAESRSTEAYNLYLKGRFFWNKRTRESGIRAINYFKQAIALDPTMAVAYAGISDASIPPGTARSSDFALAKTAAAKALSIDSTLAEAHASMGRIASHERNWREAEVHFQRAAVLDPNYPWTFVWYSHSLGAVGRLDDALVAIRRAHELDPLSPGITAHLGFRLLWLGRDAEAEKEFRSALELSPGLPLARRGIARIYLRRGDAAKAIEELQGGDPGGRDSEHQALLGYAYGIAEDRAKASAILSTLESRVDSAKASPIDVALVHLGMKENQEALKVVQRLRTMNEARVATLKADPLFDPLRSDPLFRALLRDLRL